MSSSSTINQHTAAASSSQPLATRTGISILDNGGNAADAAIAMGAVLCVTEPCSNGLGGDLIGLYHAATSCTTTSILGIGASPQSLTSSLYNQQGQDATNVHTVTVPGVVAGWTDMHSKFGSGKFSLSELLEPAYNIAKDGFIVEALTAGWWDNGKGVLESSRYGGELLIEGRAPKSGEMFRNSGVARVLKEVMKEGKKGFYEGWVGEGIVNAVKEAGGVMELNDLKQHKTRFEEPIRGKFRGLQVVEVGMPTQGVVTLVALGMLDRLKKGERKENGMLNAQGMHVLIECIRIAYAHVKGKIGDMEEEEGRKVCEELLKEEVLDELAGKVEEGRKIELNLDGAIRRGGTVQFCVIDKEGNCASMVQSNYIGFGSGIVVQGGGFSLQCRGLNFDQQGINAVSGGKRPFHTIIPALAFGQDEVICFGVMGSFMQPQGQVQVLSAMVDGGLDPLTALTLSRFRVTGMFSKVENLATDQVLIEENMDQHVVNGLTKLGHVVKSAKTELFGRGHVCWKKNGKMQAAADHRADGVALILND